MDHFPSIFNYVWRVKKSWRRLRRGFYLGAKYWFVCKLSSTSLLCFSRGIDTACSSLYSAGFLYTKICWHKTASGSRLVRLFCIENVLNMRRPCNSNSTSKKFSIGRSTLSCFFKTEIFNFFQLPLVQYIIGKIQQVIPVVVSLDLRAPLVAYTEFLEKPLDTFLEWP